ncbi:nucleotide sugar dehydrogenase [Haloarchaeobius amylolyticus]|uniref:nucleotide sugar dehydrogenase n=1 Tax=Haloarchaeobius amylolyticus TaxID=1198296 RepID=UPI00226E09B0|nr:nucleotide sugar dehydrogenase [Haloarchaeobius amylolyticus]
MSQTLAPPDAETESVCIVGLGYVGLPLTLAFAEEGHPVVGYDVQSEKVATLSNGTDPTGELGDGRVADSDATFTDDPDAIARADVVVLTVPTPVDEVGTPDLSYIESAGETVGEHMSAGTTVVLESTVYPGATEEVLVPALESTSGFTVGEEFEVGYSPERVSPGDSKRGLRDVTKIVSGRTEDVCDQVAAVYESIVDAGVYRAPDIQTAEAAKAIENVQRDINIALVNELAIACDHLDLDTEAVLEAAGTKWNFHDEYRPGLVGGHCIPVDPHLFSYQSKQEGFAPELIMKAREINEYVPSHVAELVRRAMNDTGNVPRESRVLVLGVAYKPNVGDIRTSEVDAILDDLEEYGVEMVVYDPHADADAVRENFDVPVTDSLSFEDYDGVLVGTGHDEFAEIDVTTMAERLADDGFVVDVPGALARAKEDGVDVTYRKL